MINTTNRGDLPNEFESLILAAGHYVRPSEDLRPQVLEQARTAQQERRMQRHLAKLAAVVFLAVTVLTVYRQPASAAGNHLFSPGGSAVSLDVEANGRVDERNWETVESFTDIRRRQAALLRL